MKWFVGSIFSSRFGEYDLNKTISNQFENVKIIESENVNSKNYNYYSAKNDNSFKYLERYEDESVLILGDIELFDLKMEHELQNNLNIVAHYYERFKLDFINYINGEFSMLIYDKICRKIYLIVDHLSIKSIYYKFDDGLLFASDLFLLNEILLSNDFNKEYMKEYIENFGNTNNGISPFSEVKKVNCGSIVEINVENNEIKEFVYWNKKNNETNLSISLEEACDSLEELLLDSIKNRLGTKNSVLLSGGLDSSTIFALSNMLSKTDSVSGVFKTLTSCDESVMINKIHKHLGTNSNFEVCDDCGLFSGINKNVKIYEPSPNILSDQFIKKLFSRAQDDNCTTIIDGYAGDHLFNGTPLISRDLISKYKFFRAIQELYYYSKSNNTKLIESIHKYILKSSKKPIRIPDYDLSSNNHLDKYLSTTSRFHEIMIVFQMLNASSFRYTDRHVSPNYNLTSKHPFLDKRLIDFIMTLPGNFLLNGGIPKYILRELSKKHLPHDISENITKTQHSQLTFNGICENWNTIYPIVKNFKVGEYLELDINQIKWERMLSEFRSGKILNNNIMSILSLEIWLSQF